MAITEKQKMVNKHLNGMHKHLVALREELYYGACVKKVQARRVYETLIDTMEALDNAIDPRKSDPQNGNY